MGFETWLDNNVVLFVISIIAISTWELVWKLKSMWKAGQLNEKVWFVCLMIFNTMGILPIVYLIMNKEK